MPKKRIGGSGASLLSTIPPAQQMGLITQLLTWVVMAMTPAAKPQQAPQVQAHFYSANPGDRLKPHWEFVKKCTGAKVQKGGDYKDIKWFVVSPGGMRNEQGGIVMGRWISPDTIMIDSLWLQASWVLMHEMSHHILRGKRDWSNQFDPSHPAKPFRVPCMLMPDQNLPEIYAEDLEAVLKRFVIRSAMMRDLKLNP